MNPFRFKNGQYKDVGQDEPSSCSTYCDDEQRITDDIAPRRDYEDELIALKKKVRSLQVRIVMVLVALSMTLIFFVLYIQGTTATARDLQMEWSGLLGEDPSGFVPNGIGQPLKPTYFGRDHPYYLPEDTYDDFEKSIAYVKKMKGMHNSSSVLANRRYGKTIRPDGSVTGLNPFFTWKKNDEGRQLYTLRGFHHMHCLIVVAEEFAYHFHNQSKWTKPHIAHCVNTLRDAIMCLASAQPLSFINGYGVGQITDDQADMCRDWSALRAWGNDPARGIRVIDNAPPNVTWENITEILPYPELSEMELRGLA
ncbi:hypothetical protein CCHL11_03393 [Colletotrichum chlorophyti]|uniref:Uncharacterized protein n=1 Tax=Colletotrichum chlorophyti TaxID=708187 RepID=A0A1Q8S0C1_9PEZI|nr:hypothetical protein CCHL11_03393 [Colletotrichum chlorophyti]